MTDIIKQKIDLITKYGVPGALVVWITTLQLQITELNEVYRECMKDRIEDVKDISLHSSLYGMKSFAILPKEPKIKKSQRT